MAIVLLAHLLVRVAMLLRPGGVKAVLAENLLLKQQLLVLQRSRRRAPVVVEGLQAGGPDCAVTRHIFGNN